MVRVLQEQLGAEALEEKPYDGRTVLHEAAAKGNVEIVNFLISKGALANCKDWKGRTPLFLASQSGHLGVVRSLEQHLGVVGLQERDEEGWATLHAAVFGGHAEVAAFVIGKGAQASWRDATGRTPLMLASARGYLGLIRILQPHMGPQTLQERDDEGRTALHWAVRGGRTWWVMVRLLLVAGVDPKVMNNEVMTPLAVAEENEYAEVVAVFEWWGGELERRYLLSRATCLHKAFTTHRDAPTSQVPTYLKARVAAGRAVPSVEMVLPTSQAQQKGKGGQAGTSGKRKAAGARGEALGAEAEEKEEVRHAVAEFVVKGSTRSSSSSFWRASICRGDTHAGAQRYQRLRGRCVASAREGGVSIINQTEQTLSFFLLQKQLKDLLSGATARLPSISLTHYCRLADWPPDYIIRTHASLESRGRLLYRWLYPCYFCACYDVCINLLGLSSRTLSTHTEH